MKPFYAVAIALLVSFNVNAQYFFLSNFSGTAAFGTYTCTVTSTGSVSTGGGICFPPPTEYWAGQTGPGSYIYTLNKPCYRIRVHTWGINGGPLGAGEWCQMYINGAAYALQPADVISYTECSPGGGPMYINAGRWMGPVGTTSNYNGGDYQITVCTGIISFELHCNGSLSGVAYHMEMDTVRPPSCVFATNNSPCIGDTLKLNMVGDSTGATYSWTGPGGFTSSLQAPFIFPSTFADSGWYVCIRDAGIVNDTDSTFVVIHPLPVVNASNNSPMCRGGGGTLNLYVSPDSTGETFLWIGPAGFVSTLQNPTRSPFADPDSGNYVVYATTRYGCKDTGSTFVTTVRKPPTPRISDPNYCQGHPFVPFTLDSIVSGDTVFWYTVPVGGVGDTNATTINTSIPGLYHVWVSQKSGVCESLRGTDSVRVTTTPPAPTVTGTMQYCQFIGPVTPLVLGTTVSGVAVWYNSATGGTGTTTQPLANINIAGAYNWWVSQIDSGCEGPRTPVTVDVHPKPHRPIIDSTPNCQFLIPVGVRAHPDTTGVGTTLVSPNPLLWYGPGVTPPSSVAPITPTNTAPDTIIYYVTETSIYGCVSDSSKDPVVIKVKPNPPVVKDIPYCQHSGAAKLNGLVDSIANSHLNWYYNSTSLNPTPTPFTDTVPGTYTWYVSQTVPNDYTGCESDSAAINVRIIYKPVFDIKATSPFVCQFDTVRLWYHALGQQLNAPSYVWTLPPGAMFVDGTHPFDSSVIVAFDTANGNNYVYLHTTNDSGFCASDTSLLMKVISAPFQQATTKGDVCLNDTVQIGLSVIAANSYNYTWLIDNVPLKSSPVIKLIAANSNSGGPYSISWIDTGRHVIKVTSESKEGCQAAPAYDSVNVHGVPDATFRIINIDSTGKFCIEDSVEFAANMINYNYAYEWAPEHSFNNINRPDAWGKVEQSSSMITLKVTDPYGCYATSSQTLNPATCCSVIMPNAFTPGATINRTYGPIYNGFHNFHQFRIVNRWGTTVFDGGNTNVRWDGSYNGAPQDMGVYYYYLKYDCGGKTLELKGDVTLIR